jgi:glycosyltransferase involved in cell wall biosynthesis
MRVLALTNLYPNPFQPQRATFNRQQLRILGDRHCPVRVIAPISWTDELRARRSGKPRLPKNRRVELDGLTIDHPRVFHTPGLLRQWYGKFFYWSVRRTFRRVCEEFEPTIVYAPWVYPDGWAAIQLAREAGLPVVIKAHGSDVLLLGKNPEKRSGTVEALKSADGMVAVSCDLRDQMVRLGADSERIRVIYNGLEESLFHPGCKQEARRAIGLTSTWRQLLFVGNLVPVKGIDLLLRACAALRSGGQNVQLNIVGEGPLKTNLIEQTKSLGIEESVKWHGSIPQAELPNWYRAADLLVLPSRSEGVPNVLLEATGCNTPWVATRVGGIPEIGHLGSNRLVSTEAPDELAAAIRSMLTDPPTPGERPRSPEATVKEMAAFLSEVERRSGRKAGI